MKTKTPNTRNKNKIHSLGHRMRFRHRRGHEQKKNESEKNIDRLPKIILVGNPNVGKSLVFGRLTGAYVSVSNYPGTTVTLETGKCKLNGKDFGVIDSPGLYSLIPITEEERVAKKLLLEEKPKIVLHIIDARNIERMLPLTLQLIEAGLPVMLVINMMDEAEMMGIKIDHEDLERKLGIPVIPLVATTCRGFPDLILRMGNYVSN